MEFERSVNNHEDDTVSLRPNRSDCLLFVFSGILISLIFIPFPNGGKVTLGVIIALIGFLLTTILSRIGMTSKAKKELEKQQAFDISEEKQREQLEALHLQARQEKIRSLDAKAATVSRGIIVFGVIYSAIAALGFQVALDFYYTDMHSVMSHTVFALPDINHSFLILSYFSVAVLFYHGAIIFLSTDAAVELTNGKASRVFPDFIVLFLIGVIIYYLAKDINSPQVFMNLIMTLMIVHITWVLYFYSVAKDRSVYFEWVHFDSLTFLSLLLVSLFGFGMQSYLIVFLILAVRTICDYGFAWKEFYSVYST